MYTRRIHMKELIREKLLQRSIENIYLVLDYHFRIISKEGKGFVDLLIDNPREFYEIFKQIFKSNEKTTDYILSILLKILKPDYSHIHLWKVIEGMKKGDKEIVNKFLVSIVMERISKVTSSPSERVSRIVPS